MKSYFLVPQMLRLAHLCWMCVFCAAAQASPTFERIRAEIVFGELEDALVQVQSANAQDLNDDQVSFLMAEIYGEIGQFAKAQQLLSTIQANELADQVRDQSLLLTARYQTPHEVLAKLGPRFEQTSGTAIKYLALAALKTNGSGQYIQTLKTLAQQAPGGQATLDLAWVYQQLGAYADAIQVLSVMDKPTSTVLVQKKAQALALAYGRLGDSKRACTSLQVFDAARAPDNLFFSTLLEHFDCRLAEPEQLQDPQLQSAPTDSKGADEAPSGVTQITPLPRQALKGNALAGLTLRSQGAYDANEQRVNYYDRKSDRSMGSLPIPEGVGITGASGILVGGGRFVVTNRHVVENGSYFAVKSALGGISKARVVKVSAVSDLALLEMTSPFPQEQAVSFSEFADAKAGSQIYSIGYPLWYLLGTNTPSIANGLVSKNYGMNDDPHMFQITAKVNKGNSGGPVFDAYGRLVGITTAKLDTESLRRSEGVQPEGVNFIYHAREILEFAGPMLRQEQRQLARERVLAPERLYELRLGAAVMVAVGK